MVKEVYRIWKSIFVVSYKLLATAILIISLSIHVLTYSYLLLWFDGVDPPSNILLVIPGGDSHYSVIPLFIEMGSDYLASHIKSEASNGLGITPDQLNKTLELLSMDYVIPGYVVLVLGSDSDLNKGFAIPLARLSILEGKTYRVVYGRIPTSLDEAMIEVSKARKLGIDLGEEIKIERNYSIVGFYTSYFPIRNSFIIPSESVEKMLEAALEEEDKERLRERGVYPLYSYLILLNVERIETVEALKNIFGEENLWRLDRYVDSVEAFKEGLASTTLSAITYSFSALAVAAIIPYLDKAWDRNLLKTLYMLGCRRRKYFSYVVGLSLVSLIPAYLLGILYAGLTIDQLHGFLKNFTRDILNVKAVSQIESMAYAYLFMVYQIIPYTTVVGWLLSVFILGTALSIKLGMER